MNKGLTGSERHDFEVIHKTIFSTIKFSLKN